VTGCTKNPGTKHRYCHEHKTLQQPCLAVKKIDTAELAEIRKTRIKKNSSNINEDTVLIIEAITGCKDGMMTVKFEGYERESRLSADLVPKVFTDPFLATGQSKIQAPRIRQSRRVGSVVEHELVFDGDDFLPVWTPSEFFTDLGDTEDMSCRTAKDRDKRISRHSCGIFIGKLDGNKSTRIINHYRCATVWCGCDDGRTVWK
jgi:hypothetical protein